MKSPVYVLNFPRPIGVEPTVYLKRPNIMPEIVEVEPGYFLEDPYTNPEVLEFSDIPAAMHFIENYNSSEEYLKEFRIKE